MAAKGKSRPAQRPPAGKPSSLLDTRIVYCGDCLDQLRKLPDACVDLIYIDPPFNSNRNYEVFWGETKEKRAFEDRHASTQAYIEYMRPRCVELSRVLKKTGSFYYHCDWHASHYVKVMLDQLFGENNFQNEIIWQRTGAHNDAQRFGTVTDSIFYYVLGEDYTYHPQFIDYEPEYVAERYRYKDESGRLFWPNTMTAAGPGPVRTFRGVKMEPPPSTHWRFSQEEIDRLEREGGIYYSKGGKPYVKSFLDERKGRPCQNLWTDIVMSKSGAERLGYPTQKPLALLERIINASSNKNDIVLDAFCGCGTALVAAQNLGRQWIGIDISPTACRVMAKRLRDVCKLREDEALWRAGRGFIVRDLPRSIEQLRAIPPFEFENWAVIALGGIPNKAQVGDMGIDGRIYPVSAIPKKSGAAAGELDFMDVWYPIQVKQKDRLGRPDVDSFEAIMTRHDRTKGFLVSFDYSSDALAEIGAFFRKSGKVIVALTVREILDEEIAKKLA